MQRHQPAARYPHLIAIAGPSCSGKTQLANYLQKRLRASILTTDSYYKELAHLPLDERARMNFDEPAALDEELVREHVLALARGEAVRRPTYDFTTHTRTHDVELIAPREYVIIEGLFTLYWPEVRAACATRVYIHTEDSICFTRRLYRDTHERGRTEDSVRKQYESTVRPMAKLYVWPTQKYAHIVVSGAAPLEISAASILNHINAERAALVEK